MIDETIRLVKAAKFLKSFVEYIESGGPAALLSEIELNAAAVAFQNLSVTKDRTSQLWNAVNHLESAWQAALYQVKRENKSWKNAILIHLQITRELANRCMLIGSFLALCYKLLGEQNLALKCLDTLEPLRKIGTWDGVDFQNGVQGGVTVFTWIFTIAIQMPVTAISLAVRDNKEFVSPQQLDEIEKILRSDWPAV